MNDYLTIILVLFTLIVLGVHMPPAPDLKPYVDAHRTYMSGR